MKVCRSKKGKSVSLEFGRNPIGKDKKTENPVWVCYCFDISKGMIQKEIEETGWSTYSEWISQEVKAGHCDCKNKNPSGRCCLGDVRSAEKDILRHRTS